MLRITIRTFVRCAGSSRRVGDCATFGGSDPLLTFQTKNFAVTSFGHQPGKNKKIDSVRTIVTKFFNLKYSI